MIAFSTKVLKHITIEENKIKKAPGILVVPILFNGQRLWICNIYAPSGKGQAKSKEFMDRTAKILKRCDGHKIILGDFNCTYNSQDKVQFDRAMNPIPQAPHTAHGTMDS